MVYNTYVVDLSGGVYDDDAICPTFDSYDEALEFQSEFGGDMFIFPTDCFGNIFLPDPDLEEEDYYYEEADFDEREY